jgi:outer membrane protein assembly factor BamB
MWRTPRRSKPRGGWSTPIIIDVNGHDELLLNGEFGLQAYDPIDGTPTWFCKAFNGRGTPAPAIGHGLVYVVNGKSGDVYAVKPGGKGDVTDDRMAWHTERKGGRDLPSPILVGDSLFVVNMAGIATCYDATTGDERWKVRLNGEYSGSPVSAGGLIYVCDENGIVSVVKAGEQFELIARNSVGAAKSEVFRSSPAVSQGQLFLRSTNRLFCIGKVTQ